MAQNVNSIVYSRKEEGREDLTLNTNIIVHPVQMEYNWMLLRSSPPRTLPLEGHLIGAEGEGGDPQQPEGEAREGIAMGSVSNMNVMCGCSHPYSMVRT